jgi:hypothetical protein
MTTITPRGSVPTLDTPNPQPLPGHSGEQQPAAPKGPQPRNGIGEIGLLAEYGLPLAAVAATKFGANPSIAGAAAGFGITFGAMALGISATGPKSGPSPGAINFNEYAREPGFTVPLSLAAPVGGGSAAWAVAYQPYRRHYDYSANQYVYNQPKDWVPARFAVGALWGGLAGIAAGGIAWGGTALTDKARQS